MADITQTKQGKRRKAPTLSESEKKRRKTHQNKRNKQTLIYLLSEYDRWCTLKLELGLKSDREVATFLIDRINLYPVIVLGSYIYIIWIEIETECVNRKLSLLTFLLHIVCKRARTKISGKWPRLSNSRQNIWFRIFSIISE